MNIPPKYITISIHPPEADRLADDFRSAMQDVTNQFDSFKKLLMRLDSSWEGKAKVVFMDTSLNASSSFEKLLLYLGSQATTFRLIKVQIRKINPAWERFLSHQR